MGGGGGDHTWVLEGVGLKELSLGFKLERSKL